MSTTVNIFGVDYDHTQMPDGADLYVTRYGKPFAGHLQPENWLEPAWFEKNRERLHGTSTVYKVRTKEVGARSINIVVKWCRVGEAVPIDTMTFNKFAQAEFNSPYEEFELVMEMRRAMPRSPIRTHKPLAIYVPAERLQLWQTGRSVSTIASKNTRHRDVELDIFRQYILIYEWIKGRSAVEILEHLDVAEEHHDRIMAGLTKDAIGDLDAAGYRVLDMKPAHIIVRADKRREFVSMRNGRTAYALVDFELLERTPRHAEEVAGVRRREYLRRQRDRFANPAKPAVPGYLHIVEPMGVRYVFGHAESTHGLLWVAGQDPGLFDYFLPERWRRTPCMKLSRTNDLYYTKTKDDINLVWRVSRVGEQPTADPDTEQGGKMIACGYNSPFEEFSMALELARRGVNTVYPRAIYMTGLEADKPTYIHDLRRFNEHAGLKTPSGEPILRPNHNYIAVWGYWNGMDEMLSSQNPVYCEGINLDTARDAGYVSVAEHHRLLSLHRERLLNAGMEDLNLKGDHVLLSLSVESNLVRCEDGMPDMRQCNFELMRRVG
ncbi:MAG: hypothetical protein WCL44_08635 [bacterium]